MSTTLVRRATRTEAVQIETMRYLAACRELGTVINNPYGFADPCHAQEVARARRVAHIRRMTIDRLRYPRTI